MDKKKILWITQTAIFVALLVSAQAFTRPFGQFVTGSCVNFILVSSCVLLGLPSASVIAVVSPLFAFVIMGIPAFPVLIPFMMAGNFVLVVAINAVYGDAEKKSYASDSPNGLQKILEKIRSRTYIKTAAAVITGAALKFLVLWFGIVRVALSFIPDIRQPQIDAMSATFSWPQLVTALIGSTLALTVMPNLKKALKFSGRG